MKLSSLSLPQGNLLLLGGPGSGKTTLTFQLTRNPVIIQCDNNWKGPASYLTRLKRDVSGVEIFLPSVNEKNEVVPQKDRWKRVTDFCTKWARKEVYPESDALWIDSLLTFNDFALDEVRVRQNKQPTTDLLTGAPLTLPDWGVYGAIMKNFLISLKACSTDRLTGVVAHVDTDKDELGGFLKWFIATPGQLKSTMAGLFDECWYLSSEEVKGVQTHFVRTAPGMMQDALGLKSSHGLLPKQPINFDELQKLFVK